MNLENLVGKELCSSIVEARENTDIYEEVVIPSKDISAWTTVLTEKLGPPIISAEELEIVNSSEDVLESKINVALELADSYGGVIQGQTLYHGIYESTVILILIWPWQNNLNSTLKMAIL
jgi:hypothetical protein